MSQFNVIPQSGPKSGAQMADAMQKAVDATNSAHFGATEPDYKTQGMIWVKNVSSTINEIYVYDGAQWILLGYFNPTTHALTETVLADNQVTLAKLAQISTSRILGRKTAGSGTVESLTGADVMAMLPDAVGDSGSGGVAGRVPAPPAGSDAAGYFLAADMTFKAPPSGLDPGAFGYFAMNSAPSGWLECYGQAVSRTTYAALYAAIGDSYGAGNGSTTFNLPDCRGRVIAGWDMMGGVSADRLTNPASTIGGIDGDTFAAAGGEEAHVQTVSQLAAHNHGSVIKPGSSTASIGGSNSGVSGTTDTKGNSAAFNVVQPTIIGLICIKT